jgi:hypothetical protein
MPVFHGAGVAQLVEQRIRNAKVGSSTLLTGTKNLQGLASKDLPTLSSFWRTM